MSGFPRACFSEKELNATRWYAKQNGVSNQPTIKQVKNHREDILNVAGLGTKLLDGKLGNCFAVNDWFKILKHVRPPPFFLFVQSKLLILVLL